VRILIIQTAFLGDMILTLPLIDLLRAKGAASELAVIAAPAGARLLETQGSVEEIIEFDKREADSGPSGTLRIARAGRTFGADVVLVPHRSFRSAAIAALIGAAKRIGFDESGGRALLTETVRYRARGHEIERVASLAEPLGVELPPGRIPFRVRVDETAEHGLDARLRDGGVEDRFAVLAPGSRWATKRWPEQRYAELAGRLTESGLGVVIVGGEDDREVSACVASLAGTKVLDTTGSLTLAQWLAVVRRSSVVISNDSAAAHVAAGVGTPVVAVFGPTAPEQGFAPYTDRSAIVAAELDCRPCGRHGADDCARGTHQCMEDVTVSRVFKAVRGLLDDAGSPAGPDAAPGTEARPGGMV